MLCVACDHACNVEHIGTASVVIYGNFFESNGRRIYSHESLHAGDFIYVGGDVAIERGLLDRFTAQFIHHDLSIHAMVSTLNQEAFNTNQAQLSKVDPHALSFVLYSYLYILLDLSMGNSKVETPLHVDEFDAWAWSQFPRLLSAFTYLWMNHETLVGRCHDLCSRCIVVDGNQKIRRRICGHKDVRVNTCEMQDIVIGCCRTPISGSRYCGIHQEISTTMPERLPSSDRRQPKARPHPRSRRQLMCRKYNNFLDATSCRTKKERSDQYVRSCHRSFGFIALVFNCRVIACFSELFRSETLREIINLFVASVEGELSLLRHLCLMVLFTCSASFG